MKKTVAQTQMPDSAQSEKKMNKTRENQQSEEARQKGGWITRLGLRL